MSQQQPGHTPHHTLAETAMICKEITSLVDAENDALTNRNIQFVEENLKDKSRLALKLEKMLKDLKSSKDSIKGDPAARDALKSIQMDMDSFQNTAKKNLLLLKTAHQTRADTLQMIRHIVDANRPQAETYNAYGKVEQGNANAGLINKRI